jgi:hypothetical protein
MAISIRRLDEPATVLLFECGGVAIEYRLCSNDYYGFGRSKRTGSQCEAMMFNRIDICEAYYLFACQYHNGQGSITYKIFGRLDALGFRASCMLKDEEDLNDNAREIFEHLVALHS